MIPVVAMGVIQHACKPTLSVKPEDICRNWPVKPLQEATRSGRPRKRVLRLEGVSECKCIVFCLKSVTVRNAKKERKK